MENVKGLTALETAGKAKKERTPEELKARQLRKDEKLGALQVLKTLVDEQKDPKFKEALIKIRPSLYGITSGFTGGNGIRSQFIKFVTEKNSVGEDVIFKEFKIGRKDCAGHIRKNLKVADPKDRVWISFDNKTGIYKVAGKGEKAPAGWTGFIPVDEDIDLSKGLK